MGFSEKEVTIVAQLRQAVLAGLEQKAMQRVPHLVLLSDAFYREKLAPLAAWWVLLYVATSVQEALGDNDKSD